jgi:hypothetical protein
VPNWRVRIEGDAPLARALAQDLDGTLRAIAQAVAAEAQDRIAPYPQAPSYAGRRRWYQRGYGWKWRRKDGTVDGRQTSEMMGRRWVVQPWGSRGVMLRNLASYSGQVQSAEGQPPIFRSIGWKTDQGVVDEMERDGTAERLAAQALRGAIKGLE